jgi:hypothetical protein
MVTKFRKFDGTPRFTAVLTRFRHSPITWAKLISLTQYLFERYFHTALPYSAILGSQVTYAFRFLRLHFVIHLSPAAFYTSNYITAVYSCEQVLEDCDNSILILLLLNIRTLFAVPFLMEIKTSSIDWAQQSRFYLKTGTESSLRNVVF